VTLQGRGKRPDHGLAVERLGEKIDGPCFQQDRFALSATKIAAATVAAATSSIGADAALAAQAAPSISDGCGA
jgi:hypothetical protein